MPDPQQKRFVDCRQHGKKTPAVVCRHMIGSNNVPVGFIENSSEPEDLQAWCGKCETLFLSEGEMTPKFRSFNDFAIVCTQCYQELKTWHATAELD